MRLLGTIPLILVKYATGMSPNEIEFLANLFKKNPAKYEHVINQYGDYARDVEKAIKDAHPDHVGIFGRAASSGVSSAGSHWSPPPSRPDPGYGSYTGRSHTPPPRATPPPPRATPPPPQSHTPPPNYSDEDMRNFRASHDAQYRAQTGHDPEDPFPHFSEFFRNFSQRHSSGGFAEEARRAAEESSRRYQEARDAFRQRTHDWQEHFRQAHQHTNVPPPHYGWGDVAKDIGIPVGTGVGVGYGLKKLKDHIMEQFNTPPPEESHGFMHDHPFMAGIGAIGAAGAGLYGVHKMTQKKPNAQQHHARATA